MSLERELRRVEHEGPNRTIRPVRAEEDTFLRLFALNTSGGGGLRLEDLLQKLCNRKNTRKSRKRFGDNSYFQQ